MRKFIIKGEPLARDSHGACWLKRVSPAVLWGLRHQALVFSKEAEAENTLKRLKTQAWHLSVEPL